MGVYVWMYNQARLEGSGGMLPQQIFSKLEALRVLLRPFWDRSRAVVAVYATCPVSNYWLSMYAFAKPADIKSPQEKVLRLTEQ